MVQYGDSTVYYSRIGDRHLRYPGKLRSKILAQDRQQALAGSGGGRAGNSFPFLLNLTACTSDARIYSPHPPPWHYTAFPLKHNLAVLLAECTRVRVFIRRILLPSLTQRFLSS